MKVKFICLNLWLGGKLFEPLLDFLKSEKPDILVVQEVYDSKDDNLEKRFRSIDVIKKECGLEYDYFSPSCLAIFPDGKKIPAGNAILSKFPISEKNTVFTYSSFGEVENYELPTITDFSFTPRNLQYAKVEIGDRYLNVFNTQGIWGKNSKDSEDRLKMGEIIVNEIKNKENVILGGDFNITPNTQTIENIEKYLTNIFKGSLKTTFNTKQKADPIFGNFMVDMVFASNNLNIIDEYCPEIDISDHLPLVITLDV